MPDRCPSRLNSKARKPRRHLRPIKVRANYDSELVVEDVDTLQLAGR